MILESYIFFRKLSIQKVKMFGINQSFSLLTNQKKKLLSFSSTILKNNFFMKYYMFLISKKAKNDLFIFLFLSMVLHLSNNSIKFLTIDYLSLFLNKK